MKRWLVHKNMIHSKEEEEATTGARQYSDNIVIQRHQRIQDQHWIPLYQA